MVFTRGIRTMTGQVDILTVDVASDCWLRSETKKKREEHLLS